MNELLKTVWKQKKKKLMVTDSVEQEELKFSSLSTPKLSRGPNFAKLGMKWKVGMKTSTMGKTFFFNGPNWCSQK